MCDSEWTIIVQLCPILPPLPLVLVVISRRTGHRASETDRVRLAEVRDHCGSTGWGVGEVHYTIWKIEEFLHRVVSH